MQAIIRYKKILGFYADAEDEHHSVYVIESNEIHNRYGTTDQAITAEATRQPVSGAEDSS